MIEFWFLGIGICVLLIFIVIYWILQGDEKKNIKTTRGKTKRWDINYEKLGVKK